MSRVDMFQAASCSINRTKIILFRPFSLKKWIKLLFIAFLAGALTTSSGSSGSSKSKEGKDAEAYSLKEQLKLIPSSKTGSSAEEKTQESSSDSFALFIKGIIQKGKELNWPLWYVLSLTSIGLLLTSLFVLLLWVSCRFKFIWFNAVFNNIAQIKEPFFRFKHQGNSLFKLACVLSIIGLLNFAVIGIWALKIAIESKLFESSSPVPILMMINLFKGPLILFAFFFIFWGVVAVFIDHLLVAIMAVEQCGFKDAIGKFLGIFRQNIFSLILLIIWMLLLGIFSIILLAIISFLGYLLILIMGGIIFGLPFIIIRTFSNANPIYMLLLVIFGVPFVIIAIVFLALLGLPFSVFFRNFSMYFLGYFNSNYLPKEN